MNVQRTIPLGLITALLLAILAMTPVTTSAAGALVSSGNIVDNRITSLAYDPVTSNATIGGEIRCSVSTEVTVYGIVSQYRYPGEHLAQYYGGIELECKATPTRYSVTVTRGYESDRLVPGTATIGFWAEYYEAGSTYGFPTYRDMRLMPTP